MNLSIEQRQLLSAKATELADSIEAGTYKGPIPTNSRGWCGCAAGLLLAEAGMPVAPIPGSDSRWFDPLGELIEDLGLPFVISGLTDDIAWGLVPLSALIEPYRRIASRLLGEK